MSRMSRLVGAAGATVAIAAGTAPAAGAAESNPYGPQQVCGAGYGVVDQHDLRARRQLLATVYLLYNGASGTNCSVTIKRKRVGIPDFVGTGVYMAKGKKYDADEGSFSYYAGPTYLSARGRCVKWGGFADLRAIGLTTGWLSGPGHCG